MAAEDRLSRGFKATGRGFKAPVVFEPRWLLKYGGAGSGSFVREGGGEKQK